MAARFVSGAAKAPKRRLAIMQHMASAVLPTRANLAAKDR